MSLDLKSGVSIRDQWAHLHATRGVKEVWNKKLDGLPVREPGFKLPPLAGIDIPGRLTDDDLPKLPKLVRSGEKRLTDATDIKVCIVGAGAAGLFTGMIFDYLNKELAPDGFNVSYEILETAGKDRVGGRLYTYNFNTQVHPHPQHSESQPQGVENQPQDLENQPQDLEDQSRISMKVSHEYYDVGAMRFPENPVMTRVFSLFKYLEMNKRKLADNPPIGSLIPYYMQNIRENEAVGEYWRYNDITIYGDYARITAQSPGNDPWRMNTGDIPSRLMRYAPGDIMNAAIEPLREALAEDLKTSPPGKKGWTLLMKYDTFSTRQFLREPPPEPLPKTNIPPPPYNYDTIEWLETFNGGTNWYDQAHSETVLESLDFEYPDIKTEWYCVLGGAQQLALRMQKHLKHKPVYNTTVNAIRADGIMKMEVDYEARGSKHTREYAGVFNSTTLGCLKRIDTSKTNLNYPTKQAIRSLGYGPSAKVGIKFRRAWWIHDLGNYSVKKGGLGHSDLTIRTCVYPSYNIDDPPNMPAVLLCSYTWQQDAERIGALMSSSSSHAQQLHDEVKLKELLLRDLARLHTHEGTTEEDVYKLISKNYLDHYSHDWTHDPNSAGAFAFFRPQQFSQMWNKMIQPSGDLIIIGEASSPHHAWVVGALESAVHGVYSWLYLNEFSIPGATEALELLRTPNDPKNPFVGLPPYMQEETAEWGAFLGSVDRENYFQGLRDGERGAAGLAQRLKSDQ